MHTALFTLVNTLRMMSSLLNFEEWRRYSAAEFFAVHDWMNECNIVYYGGSVRAEIYRLTHGGGDFPLFGTKTLQGCQSLSIPCTPGCHAALYYPTDRFTNRRAAWIQPANTIASKQSSHTQWNQGWSSITLIVPCRTSIRSSCRNSVTSNLSSKGRCSVVSVIMMIVWFS